MNQKFISQLKIICFIYHKRLISLSVFQKPLKKMGIIMHKLIEVGQYCDCLENWKKYEIPNESQSQSNLFMSENDSNLDDPIDQVFNHEKIQSGLDKELELMHQRLKKRKKLKAQYLKQKEKQVKAKQKQEERVAREKREKIQRQRQLWLRQLEIKKQKDIEAERLRKQKKEKEVKANKRNKRIREKNLEKHDLLQVEVQNNTFSTTDQKSFKNIKPENQAVNMGNVQEPGKQAQKPQIVQSSRQKEQNPRQESSKNVKEKEKKHKKSKKTKKQKKRRRQFSSQSSKSSQSPREVQYQNVFEQPDYYHEQIPQHTIEQDVSDLDSALFQKHEQQKTQLQIIDLQKLNPNQLRQEISHLAIQKIKGINDDRIISQTMPLHPAIHSHRISNANNYETRNNHLRFKGKQDYGQEDVVEFGDGALQSTIIEKESNDYFLDQNDKEEYIKEMFK